MLRKTKLFQTFLTMQCLTLFSSWRYQSISLWTSSLSGYSSFKVWTMAARLHTIIQPRLLGVTKYNRLSITFFFQLYTLYTWSANNIINTALRNSVRQNILFEIIRLSNWHIYRIMNYSSDEWAFRCCTSLLILIPFSSSIQAFSFDKSLTILRSYITQCLISALIYDISYWDLSLNVDVKPRNKNNGKRSSRHQYTRNL